MTEQERTIEQIAAAAAEALAAAGRELAVSLQHTMAEIGPRLIATTALGQVFAGLPDAARGMISHLPPEHVYAIADAAAKLHEIAADLTPEAAAATKTHSETPADVAQGLLDAGVYLDAWHQRRDLRPKLAERNVGQLLKMRGAAVTLIAAIDRQVRKSS